MPPGEDLAGAATDECPAILSNSHDVRSPASMASTPITLSGTPGIISLRCIGSLRASLRLSLCDLGSCRITGDVSVYRSGPGRGRRESPAGATRAMVLSLRRAASRGAVPHHHPRRMGSLPAMTMRSLHR